MPQPAARFHNFVGHAKQIAPLLRQLQGAKSRGEAAPHCLFVGPSGVGKTQLANGLGEEYGSNVIRAHGYDSATQIGRKLRLAKHGDFVFVDEAQLLSPKVQELLYLAIDDQVVVDDSGDGDSAERHQIEPCTMLLATDQPGKLLNALNKRMELVVTLGYYCQHELKEIVDLLATSLNMLISPQAANAIAQASGGIPRRALHHLGNLRRHFAQAESQQLSIGDVREYLLERGVDESGLDDTARGYLSFLHREGKASLESLALFLGVDSEYVRRQIEPQLQRLRLIVICSGGRRLSSLGTRRVAEFAGATIPGFEE